MRKLLGIFALFLLVACSDYNRISISSSTISISEQGKPNSLDSLIAPYRDKLEDEMNEVIAFADTDFVKGRPNASLNNWAADAVLTHQTQKTGLIKLPVMVLLNVGGLRSSINKGEVTIGDMYRVMPFDNEVVWVEMPVSSMDDIALYLKTSGGEPISGATMKDGKLTVSGLNDTTSVFWVITSDYLMNGGDKMTFFEDRISFFYADVLLRDLFIEEAISEGQLIFKDDNRIEE